ncbi:unnamed protein product [Mytilus edulis]|uniref:Uncharacterized protein n=1 Tax=Mytilus edulis TaxID=6550 RepID=A0A8S3SE19_MYTED|nr:unnamed protein product [Mytilus edulis]
MNATEISYKSNIRIPNDQTVIIPAGTIKMIEAQARPAPKGHVLDCIVEENTTLTMPNGFQLASAVVSVRQDGRIPVQICKYSNTNIKLKPKTMIGCAMTQNDSAHDKETAEVNSQTVCPVTNNDYLGKMDVGSLTSEQQLQLKDLNSPAWCSLTLPLNQYALIDSGSDINVINEQVIKTVNCRKVDSEEQVEGNAIVVDTPVNIDSGTDIITRTDIDMETGIGTGQDVDQETDSDRGQDFDIGQDVDRGQDKTLTEDKTLPEDKTWTENKTCTEDKTLT